MKHELLNRFRQATDLEPSGKTSLRGPSRCTPDEMRTYVARRNPDAPDVAEWYVRIGDRYGIRGDLAYCHAVFETKAWTSPHGGRRSSGDWWMAGDGAALSSAYPLKEEAVEAHIRQLSQAAMAGAEVGAAGGAFIGRADEGAALGLAVGSIAVQRADRSRTVCWEDLSGIGTDGSTGRRTSGRDVVAIWRRMLEWAGKGGTSMEENNSNEAAAYSNHRDEEGQAEGTRALRSGGNAQAGDRFAYPEPNADLAWLKARGLLPQPAPEPNRLVSWAEIGELLRRLEGSRQVEASEVSSKEKE